MTGCCWGLALQTRTSLLLGLVPAGLYLLYFLKARRRELIPCVLTILVLFSPWVYRNWQQTGQWVWGTTWNVRSVYHGIQNISSPDFESDPRRVDQESMDQADNRVQRMLGVMDSPLKELSEDRLARQWVIDEVLKSPIDKGMAMLRGVFRIWFVTSSCPMRWMYGLIHLLLLFGISRAVARLPRPCPPILVFCVVLFFGMFLFHATCFPMVRYLAPMVPVMALLAGFAVLRSSFSRC